MKIFSPEHPPIECTVQGSPSPKKELGATNGLGIVRLVRGKRSMQTEMGAYHPGKRCTFSATNFRFGPSRIHIDFGTVGSLGELTICDLTNDG